MFLFSSLWVEPAATKGLRELAECPAWCLAAKMWIIKLIPSPNSDSIPSGMMTISAVPINRPAPNVVTLRRTPCMNGERWWDSTSKTEINVIYTWNGMEILFHQQECGIFYQKLSYIKLLFSFSSLPVDAASLYIIGKGHQICMHNAVTKLWGKSTSWILSNGEREQGIFDC